MTDSESDSSNNVYAFQNVSTTFSAKGPNVNLTNLSFRNPLTSTMCMPRNRPRYAESVCDQRSMYYRRETSPMSIHSACDIRPRNFPQYYPGMSSQRSVFNGRSGSPVSMRSMDSTASVSAADIVFAFKNAKFNKYDLKEIKNAYHKLMKQRVRKRIEKRRNMRLFLKGRRKSGYDSGEQGSNSSISSDDGRSAITSYKENMSSARSERMDLADFRRTVRDSNMVKDCSENFRQNNFRNMFSIGSRSVVNQNQNISNSVISKPSNAISTQRDRFKNGYLLPSQRFNRSVASLAIPESTENNHKSTGSNGMSCAKNHYAQNKHNGSGTDDEIFTGNPIREKRMNGPGSQGKRSLDSDDDISLPEKKRSKISSPISKPKNDIPVTNNNDHMTSFEFAKPTLPVRKSKPKVQEKLIAKSAQPLTDFLEPIPNKVTVAVEVPQPITINEKCNDTEPQLKPDETTQNDVSMQPSFMKRKLFTQTLDVTEKANLSDSNSPQNSVYSLQKEKNKARKLVTNQSCLNREVNDDSNLLDLIHKIVPPDRINVTNQSTMNHTKPEVNNRSKKDEEKWDITSVLSTCNEDDVSDTYTDEEIFNADNTKRDTESDKKGKEYNKKNVENNKNNVENNKKNDQYKSKETKPTSEKQTKIVEEKKKESSNGLNIKPKANQKLSEEKIEKQIVNQNINIANNVASKNCVKSSVNSFWDTDLESDMECDVLIPRINVMNNILKANAALNSTKLNQDSNSGSNVRNLVVKVVPYVSNKLNNTTMNNTITNNTLDTMRKFDTSTLSIKTHRTSNKKKMNETCIKETNSKAEKQNNVLDKKKENANGINKNNVEKTNSETVMKGKNKDTTKPKSSNDKCPKKRDTSHTRKNSPKYKSKPSKVLETPKTKGKTDSKPNSSHKNKNIKQNKEVEHSKNKVKSDSKPKDSPKDKNSKLVKEPKNNKKSESKSKTQSKPNADKPNENVNNKTKQTKSTSDKNKNEKQTEALNNTKLKGDSKINKKYTQSKCPKSKIDRQNRSMKGKPSANLNESVEISSKNVAKNGRPIRSTPSRYKQSELSRTSTLNITGEINKSLRSRVVNMSSSIENISLQIKPKNKPNNKIFSQINTRKSDVSFSLGLTPTPRKSVSKRKR